MSFGQDKPAKARAMIAAKGKLVGYEPMGTGTLDPELLAVLSDAAVARQVRAVITDARVRTNEGTSFKTMRVFLVSAIDIPSPARGDRFTDGAQAWTIETVQTTYAGDFAVIHNCMGEAA